MPMGKRYVAIHSSRKKFNSMLSSYEKQTAGVI